MNYWIVVITEDNLEISIREKIISFVQSKATVIKSFQPDDIIVFYVSRESLASNKRVGKFAGLAKVKGEKYHSSSALWNNGIFPQRVRIEPISQHSCDIKTLIGQLHFIRNKKHWGASFMSGIIRISQEDFEVILECMKKETRLGDVTEVTRLPV